MKDIKELAAHIRLNMAHSMGFDYYRGGDVSKLLDMIEVAEEIESQYIPGYLLRFTRKPQTLQEAAWVVVNTRSFDGEVGGEAVANLKEVLEREE